MKTIPQHTLDFLDSWLTLRSKWDDAPGFAVTIMKDGGVIFDHAYGKANIETGELLTPGHQHRIASHSKTFTATALLQLQEAGKLRIDDTVVTYLPWLGDHSDVRWQEVTLRQLMSHGAGVIRDGLDSTYWSLRRPFPTVDELQAAIMEADLVLEPNTELKYSNYGYSLLGLVVEIVSGQSYATYVAEHIFTPLQMVQTAVDLPVDSESLATGYTRLTLTHERLKFPHVATNSLAPATGFVSTAQEIAAFHDALLPGTGKLLGDAAKKEMRHMQWRVKEGSDDGYGLGLDIVRRRKRTLTGHSGGFPGFVSRTWADAADRLVVSVIANAHGTRPSLWANAIIDLIDEFGDESPKDDLLKYEVRVGGLHGVGQVIAHPGGLRFIGVNSWWPLDQMETLKVVDDSTLKIVKTSAFSGPGELIHYHFNDDGSVHHIIDSGSYREVTIDGDVQPTWT